MLTLLPSKQTLPNYKVKASLLKSLSQKYFSHILMMVTFFVLLSTTTTNALAIEDSPFAQTNNEFLNVEDAYQTSVTQDGRKLRFQWDIAEAYYLYRHRLSLKLKTEDATTPLAFTIPDGLKKFDDIFQEDVETYYNSLTLSAELPSDIQQPYELLLGWQGCADAGLCYEPQTHIFTHVGGVLTRIESSLIGQTVSSKTSSAKITPPNSAASTTFLPLVLLGALIGGMILNLMPCVFPVLSLKALSLASGNAAQHRIHGWAYTAGVVMSFAVVAGIMIIAKSTGVNLGWGFQLQQPVFVAALVYLFFLLAMNLFGLFEIGTSWMGVGQQLTQGNGISSSFFTGVLAAVVASPCTAPFMASAIGFTLSQSNLVALLVFVAIGLGMALPYLLLSHSPALAARLPKPGPWMDTFKQFLAFPLLFTCVWLLVVVGNQTSAYAMALLVGGTVALAMAFWLWKKQPQSNSKWLLRAICALLVLAAINIAYRINSHTENEHWQAYSPTLLDDLRSENKAVFIDLTADWCITCKINERVALTEKVLNFAVAHDIAMLRGDWTNSDPDITALLHRFNRNGVPLYLMYPANSESQPELLPQLLTQGSVIEAMKRGVQK